MIIADTGFFIAVLNTKDQYHESVKNFLKNSRELLITTWPVFTEACHIILKRAGVFPMTQFVSQITRGSCQLYSISQSDQLRLPKLLAKYRNLPMDLADASLILLAEHLGHGRILTTDQRDFGTYRWKERKPFQNLLKSE